MATITIKIDSEDLARDVLIHLGYLPDDVPDLVSSEEDEDEDEPEETPQKWYENEKKELDTYVEKCRKGELDPTDAPNDVAPIEKDVGAPINDETV
jgi:hypothetical protein